MEFQAGIPICYKKINCQNLLSLQKAVKQYYFQLVPLVRSDKNDHCYRKDKKITTSALGTGKNFYRRVLTSKSHIGHKEQFHDRRVDGLKAVSGSPKGLKNNRYRSLPQASSLP